MEGREVERGIEEVGAGMSTFSDNLSASYANAQKGKRPKTLIEFFGRGVGWLMAQTLGRLLRLILPTRVQVNYGEQIGFFLAILAAPLFFGGVIAGCMYVTMLLSDSWTTLPLILIGLAFVAWLWRFAGAMAKKVKR